MSGITCVVVLFLVFQIVCDNTEFENGMRSSSQWVGGCGVWNWCRNVSWTTHPLKKVRLEKSCLHYLRVARLAMLWPISKNLTIFNCAGDEITHLAIFSICHCKIKFSLNILSFLYFWTVFMPLIVTVTK